MIRRVERREKVQKVDGVTNVLAVEGVRMWSAYQETQKAKGVTGGVDGGRRDKGYESTHRLTRVREEIGR